MELTILDYVGLPEGSADHSPTTDPLDPLDIFRPWIDRIWGSILSVRSGPTRRQSPLPCSAPFRHAARERERVGGLDYGLGWYDELWWIMMICHLNSFGMLWISRWQALYQSIQNLFESFDEYHDMQCIQYFDHSWSTIFCEFRLRCLSSWYLGRLPPGPWPLRIDVLGLLGRSGHVFAPQWHEKVEGIWCHFNGRLKWKIKRNQ